MYLRLHLPWPVQFLVSSLQEDSLGKQAGRMPGRGSEARIVRGEVEDSTGWKESGACSRGFSGGSERLRRREGVLGMR